MSLGPFLTYVPPGAYTRTLTEANVANIVAGLRIPFVIGVGQETLEQDDLELVRGSSATLDEQIVNEDVSLQWVVNSTNPNNPVLGAQTGGLYQFVVRNGPIVDGSGIGRVTNNPATLTVTVNGTPVVVAQVKGAKGLVTLQLPTQPTDHVLVSYYFHRGDTAFTDDVSSQVTSTSATLTSPGYGPYAITTGSNDQFIIIVNGVSSQVTLPGGTISAAFLASTIPSAVANLSASVFTDSQGLTYLQLTTPQSLQIGAGTANGVLGWSSGTKTNRNQTFRVFQRPIVDGSGGGVTTTDPSKVVVKVASPGGTATQVIPTAVDGTNGLVTLAFAPSPGSTVTINYFANTWQNTFDYLPNSLVATVLRCGIAPSRSDYIQNTDFVVSNPTADSSIISWGTSFTVAAGTTSSSSTTPFSTSQITGLLVDNKMWLAECSPVTNTTVIPAVVSTTQFILPEVPTTGNGRDTTLGSALYSTVTNSRQDLVTNRPDLVIAYAGENLRDALNRGTQVVTAVDGASRTITLQNPCPPDWTVFATFYYNDISDDTYILTCATPGAVGTGQYTVQDTASGNLLYQVRYSGKSGISQVLQWPRGSETIPDACFSGIGTPVSETVTVTFSSAPAQNAVVTNRNSEPYNLFASSANWDMGVNGGTPAVTNLLGQARGYLVSGQVELSGGNITIPASPNNVLNLVIDGTAVSATLTTDTPTNIVAAINLAIDTAIPVGAPHSLCKYAQIGSGNVFFLIKSLTAPAALPGGFDAVSSVSIAQGTVESHLGFKTYQKALGTSGAINKPATLLGSVAGSFSFMAGLNDVFVLSVDGIQYQVPFGTASLTIDQVVTAINGVVTGIASNGTLANAGFLRLTSTTNAAKSNITIGGGSANAVLGFVQNQMGSQTQVTAQEVVDELFSQDVSWPPTDFVAYVDSINSQNYITIESLTTGVTASNISFLSTSNSAFNQTTNIGLTAGVDGDNGEDPQEIFTVSSSAGSSGSHGTGIPGQTYTDTTTGLRFTILPSQTGAYDTGHFTLTVSQTFQVDPSRPWYSIPGLETTVSNTASVFPTDTGTIQTVNPSGVSPAIGDFYFLSYQYQKQDFSPAIYRQLSSIEAAFGDVSATNRVSLGSYLTILNGALLVGVQQVLKVPGTNQASDSTFISAIQGLSTPLPGGIKPDILVPLGTSTAIYSYLTQHCETMSLIQNQSERMGFIGFASGTIPSAVQTIVQSLVSNRIAAFYPDSSVITLTDELGNTSESLVDGTFFSAAVSGAVVSPSVDVATPWTRRRLQGITSIPRILDPITANQTAVAGVTLIENLTNLIRIRQGLTTNMSSILTRLPTVTQIADFVQQQSRNTLDQYVGTKFLSQRTNEVNVSMTSLFKQLVHAEVVGGFTGISSNVDPNDPTTLQFEAYYQPIFPLEYLVLTFNLRAQI